MQRRDGADDDRLDQPWRVLPPQLLLPPLGKLDWLGGNFGSGRSGRISRVADGDRFASARGGLRVCTGRLDGGSFSLEGLLEEEPPTMNEGDTAGEKNVGWLRRGGGSDVVAVIAVAGVEGGG